MISKRHKKALLISFFFPPLGGGGIQRMLKFATYLPDYQWQPVVLTVKKWQYQAHDDAELNKITYPVYRASVLNWQLMYELLYKFRLNAMAAFLKKNESQWLFPDRMIGWLPHAYRLARRIIVNEKPTIICTTSPPQTAHLIGYLLKQKTGLPWIADFRDEWSDYQFLKWPPMIRSGQRVLEKRVLSQADAVTTVTPDITNLLQRHVINQNHKFHTIFNGYDPDDLPQARPAANNQRFRVMHAGTLYGNRNADFFLLALKRLLQTKQISSEKISIEFIGSRVNSDSLPIINHDQYLPHRECLELLNNADLLLLIQSAEGKTGIPGKTFEYLALQKPLLALIPPHSTLHRLLIDFGVTTICPFDDVAAIAAMFFKLYENWEKKQPSLPKPQEGLKQYTRQFLTEQLASLFNQLAGDRR